MNKTIDYYMGLPYKREIVEDPYEGGFVISFPELPGCITTAETCDRIWEDSEDAKRTWLEAAIEDNVVIPEPKQTNDYSGQFKIRVPKSLHKQLAEDALREGISMNQYCVYLLASNRQRQSL